MNFFAFNVFHGSHFIRASSLVFFSLLHKHIFKTTSGNQDITELLMHKQRRDRNAEAVIFVLATTKWVNLANPSLTVI